MPKLMMVKVCLVGFIFLSRHSAVKADALATVTEQTCLTFTSTDSCKLSSTAAGSYTISGKLKTITIVGVWTEPSEITLNGSKVKDNQIEYDGSLGRIKITGLVQDLNSAWELMW